MYCIGPNYCVHEVLYNVKTCLSVVLGQNKVKLYVYILACSKLEQLIQSFSMPFLAFVQSVLCILGIFL